MARLLTVGFDTLGNTITPFSAVNPENPNGLTPVGTLAGDVVHQRSGQGCLAAATSITASYVPLFTPSASKTFYVRAYLRVGFALPTSTTGILGTVGSVGVSARLTSAGKLQLWNNVAGTQIGSDSAVTIALNTYYRVELQIVVNASPAILSGELRLDGVTVATFSALNLAVGAVSVGTLTVPGGSFAGYYDDVAVNDSTGTVNNTWPGDGKVILLKPITDVTNGSGWTLGTGTAISGNSGATAISNTPPLGVADLTAGSDTKQIRNAAASANSPKSWDTPTYAASGIGASDTYNAIQAWVCTGAPVTTSAKLGTVGIAQNPTIAEVNLGAGGTAGAFWSGVAAGNYPTGWKWSPSTVFEAAPTLPGSLGARVSLTQVTSSTRIAMVCFVGVYVDYTPFVAPTPKSLVAAGNRDLRSRAVPHLMIR